MLFACVVKMQIKNKMQISNKGKKWIRSFLSGKTNFNIYKFANNQTKCIKEI